ncbi:MULTISPECIES: AAA family ATPase [Shewanella]|uniref:AAA family ATPase n=1 Tax=Shewanella TaxID=22 RepID=UPI000DF87DDC|nr:MULTISPECIES: AAA family ATPase [Shewanella]MCU8004130.1 AAA family ATPase [Shewanella sp. SM96]SUI78381.1 chromosome segregation protein [Shewanella baltica]
MIIKNLKVEEGFFSNLDLSFTSGLNVLIGGRGVGKTSIIELLRFGLASGNLSVNSNDSSGHAISILQSSGRVSIELEHEGRVINVSRSAMDKQPIFSEPFMSPIVFSQTEIETIGLNIEGKLNLIDSFIPDIQDEIGLINNLNRELASGSAQLIQLRRELAELKEKTALLVPLRQREQLLQAQQANFEKQNQAVANSQRNLNEVQGRLATLMVDIQNLDAIKSILKTRIHKLSGLITEPALPELYTVEASNLNTLLKGVYEGDRQAINQVIHNNVSTLSDIEFVYQQLMNLRLSLDVTAREKRTEVESFTEGAGAVLSELGRVKQEIAQLENLNQSVLSKENQQATTYQQCQSLLEKIYSVKNVIFEKRNAVVQKLNLNLYPTIKTSILPQANLVLYAEALENTLRGSGLKYKELIPVIVNKISPAWLLYYSHALKYEDFAAAIGVPADRATRILAYLNEKDIANVLVAKVEDIIEFTLLDNGIYKNISELSIGQRCTVALSVILENPNRVLIIDQPEDHLDNEFIAQTLIKAIQQRATLSQTILSSHNANIPVLGNASNVVNLDSNGRRGFIKCMGSTGDKHVKDVIEAIMEGGREAFKKRSEFYSV